MVYDKYKAEKEIAEALHNGCGKESFDVGTLWALVKFCKMIRLRCRSNSALNSTLSRMFPYAKFDQVPKINPKTLERYEGLRITLLDGTVIEDDEAE